MELWQSLHNIPSWENVSKMKFLVQVYTHMFLNSNHILLYAQAIKQSRILDIPYDFIIPDKFSTSERLVNFIVEQLGWWSKLVSSDVSCNY